MEQKYKDLISAEFRNCVSNTIERIESEPTYRPFHSALLSEQVLYWSRFERSFSTSFGQRVIEEIARLVALSNGASDAKRQKETIITIDENYLKASADHIQDLRDGKHIPYDWSSTIAHVKNTTLSGRTQSIRIISDLWWKKDGIDNYISLKTVKPNIDQTAVAKQDCINLTIANPECNAYFGLPYNPYGEHKTDYAHNPPMGIFDFQHDSVVLIGKEMWDTIGGTGCYEEILEIAQEVGIETKEIIDNIR